MHTRKLTILALLTAAALALHVVEAQFPPPVPIQGVKLGLANIVTLAVVFTVGPKEGAAVLFCRIFLGCIFAGNFSSILYAGAGGLASWVAAVLLRQILKKGQLWVAGIICAMVHACAQIAVAVWVTGTAGVVLYLPILLVFSMITGLFTGLCTQILLKRGKNLWKTIFK